MRTHIPSEVKYIPLLLRASEKENRKKLYLATDSTIRLCISSRFSRIENIK